MNLQIPDIIPGDWTRLSHTIRAIRRILGTQAVPTFAGAIFTGAIQAADFAKTGWPITSGVTLSFSYPTFTVTDGGSAYYYVDGVKYILDGNKTVDITDTEGMWYIYFDGATLTASQTIWSFRDEDKALVAMLYWDATNNEEIFIGWELHTFHMNGATHARLHWAGGARWETGLLASDAGSERINISAGDIWDEDINIPITDGAGGSLFEQVLSPAELPVYYRDGASAWRIYETTDKDNATDAGYIDGSNDLKYNKLNGTWANATVGLNNYVAYYVIATNEQTEPVALIMGQRVDNKLSDAKVNNVFSGLALDGLPFEEMVVLARLILKDTATYTLEEVLDLRAYNVKGNIVSSLITQHAGLGGLDFASAGHSGFQAQGDVLDDLNTLGIVGADSEFLVGTAEGALAWESGATVRTSLGLGSGNSPTFAGLTIVNAITEFSTDDTLGDDSDSAVPTEQAVKAYVDGLISGLSGAYQPLDDVLTDLAALTAVADNEFIVGTGAGAYAYESGTTVRTSMGLGTGDSPTFAGLTLADSAVVDDARGLSSIHTLVTNAKSDGIAGYFEGHIDGTTDGPTYGMGAWLNVDSGSTTLDIRALDIGIYESGADCTGGNAYGLAIHMEFDNTNSPAAIYPFRLNCNVAGAIPDALIFAANKKALAITEGSFPFNNYLKIVVQDGTVYRIPVVTEGEEGVLSSTEWDTAYGWGDHSGGGYAISGGAEHNGFSDYVANEHIDWTTDQGATNIDAGNLGGTPAFAGLTTGTILPLSDNQYNLGNINTRFVTAYLIGSLVDGIGSSITVAHAEDAYDHSGVSSGNPHSVAMSELTDSALAADLDGGSTYDLTNIVDAEFEGTVGIGTTPVSTTILKIDKTIDAYIGAGLHLQAYNNRDNVVMLWTGLNFEVRFKPPTTQSANRNAAGVYGALGYAGIESQGSHAFDVTGGAAYGLYAGVISKKGASHTGDVTLTTGYGLYIKDGTASGGGTITTLYGVYVAAQTAGATNWGLAVNTQSYINANLRVGSAVAPTDRISVTLTTENLDIVDAGSVDATEQDWIEVKVDGNTGYIRVFAAK